MGVSLKIVLLKTTFKSTNTWAYCKTTVNYHHCRHRLPPHPLLRRWWVKHIHVCPQQHHQPSSPQGVSQLPTPYLFGHPLSSCWWIVAVHWMWQTCMSPQTPTCLFFTVFLLVIVNITPYLWSHRRSLWMLCLTPSFVGDLFCLWVLLWFVLIHYPLLPFVFTSPCPFVFLFFGFAQKSSRTDHIWGILDYPARDTGLRDPDHELITKITKPLCEVSVILFTNRSPDDRLQLVNRDPDHDQIMIWSPLRDQQPKNGHPLWSCSWSDHEHVIRQIWSHRSWSTWWLQTAATLCGKHLRCEPC